MRGFRYIFPLLLFSLLFSTNNAQAQWEKTDFPKTLVDTYTLFAKGDTILAGTERGIYFSGDNGDNWHQFKSLREIDIDVSSFAYNDSYVFAGHKYGVERFPLPLDNNASQPVNSGLENADAKNIKTLLEKDGYLFAGTLDGLYRSSNNGDNWVALDTVFTGYSKTVTSIIAADGSLFASTYNGIFRSQDNGDNWTAVNKDSDKNTNDVNRIAYLAYENGFLYAAASNLDYDPESGGYSPSDGIYRSDDFGDTWEKVSDGFTDNAEYRGVKVLSLTAHNGQIYTGTEHGLYRSSDDGQSWTFENEIVNDDSKYFQALAVSGNYLYAGTEGGLYRSSDDGSNWEESDLLRFLIVQVLKSRGDSLLAGTDDGVYSSTDDGVSWTPILDRSGEDSTYILSLALWGDDIFAGSKDGIFRSTDDGSTWEELIADSSKTVKHIHSLTVWENYLFAGTKRGVYRSSDQGDHWEEVNNGIGIYSNEITVIKGFGQYLYAGNSSGVYRSDNNGDSWDEVGKLYQIGVIPITDFIEKDNYLFAGTRRSGIFASSNNAQNWTGSSSGIPRSGTGNNSWVYTFSEHNNYLFAGTYVGMYSSSNTGLSWQAWNEGLEDEIDNSVYASATHNGYLFGGMREIGVIRRPLSEITTSNEPTSAQIPDEFNLKQNYPNPFNPSTTFTFNLPDNSFVSLKVYDMTGREVATILSKNMTAGTYSKSWNAENLASGVYIYRLEAGSFSQTKKLTLIK